MTGPLIPIHFPDEELLAYAHGELPDADAARVRAHLAECSACTEEITLMREITQETRNLAEAAPAPPELRRRILSGLRFREEVRRVNRFQWLKWAAVAGMAAVLLAAIIMPLFSQTREVGRRALMGPPDAPETPSAASAARPSKLGSDAGTGTSPSFMDLQQRNKVSQPVNGMTYPTAPGVTPEDVRKYTQGKEAEDVKRKVVRRVEMGVRLHRPLEEVQDLVSARMTRDGGFVETSAMQAPEQGDRNAHMVLRVPVDKLDAAITWLSSLGEVTSKNASGEDVTTTWVDQRAQVRVLREEESRLNGEIAKAVRVADRERLRVQLLRLRVRIRQAEEQFAYTGKLAALSTIELTLNEEAQARLRGSLLPDVDNTFRGAVAAFLVAVRVPITILIWLLVFSPLWLPCALLYRWASRRAREA